MVSIYIVYILSPRSPVNIFLLPCTFSIFTIYNRFNLSIMSLSTSSHTSFKSSIPALKLHQHPSIFILHSHMTLQSLNIQHPSDTHPKPLDTLTNLLQLFKGAILSIPSSTLPHHFLASSLNTLHPSHPQTSFYILLFTFTILYIVLSYLLPVCTSFHYHLFLYTLQEILHTTKHTFTQITSTSSVFLQHLRNASHP